MGIMLLLHEHIMFFLYFHTNVNFFRIASSDFLIIFLVNHEQPFKDKCFLYRFWQDEEGATALPTLEDIATAEDQLQETLTTLIHRGPDAMMRMILRKP